MLETRELSDDEKARADINQDGKISALDMLRYTKAHTRRLIKWRI